MRRFFIFSLGIALFVLLSCSGDAGPKVNVSVGEWDFGVVYVNYSLTNDFILENKTNEEVEILIVTIFGSNEFIVTAGGVGTKIAPKDISVLTVMFEPVNKGYEEATLTIIHSASTKEIVIDLEATGETKPEFSINPPSQDFGALSKTLSASKDFTVTNVGTAVLMLSDIDITGSDASEFTITQGGSTPINIDPSDTHVISIRWDSVDPVGMKAAELEIIHNAEGSPCIVTLSAETLAFPPLVITSTTMPNATNWTQYNETVQITGGLGPYTYSIILGDLPEGLTLNASNGEISGKPHYLGTENFTVEVADTMSQVSQALSIEVISKNTWDNVTPSGFSLGGNGMCIAPYNHKLYFCGGSSTRINIYDPNAGTWQTASTSLSTTHRLGNACVYDKYIYIIAGSGTTTVERYDPTANTIAIDTPAPSTIYDFAVGVHNNEIYCISSASIYTGVWKFTPGSGGSNGTWATLPNTSTSCFGAGLTDYNGVITVFGGYSGGELNSVRSYNPTNGAEAHLGSLATSSGRFPWGRVGDYLYIASGSSNNFQKYNLSTNTGTMLASCPTRGTYYASQYTECDGRIFVTDFGSTLYAYTP